MWSSLVCRRAGPLSVTVQKECALMKELDELPTVHYTELPEWPADSPTYRECRTFRRELPRLLADGHEGKWALIKGDDVIALCATLDEGHRMGRQRFLMQPFIVQPVREWQPVLPTRVRI